MKRRWIILIVAGAIILAIRIALPFIIVNYANSALEDLEGYDGYVKDVDLRLFRGAYKIDSLVIVKEEGDFSFPFVAVPEIDLSLHWKALFNGAIAGEVVLTRPELNFAFGGKEEEKVEQYGEDADWSRKCKAA